MAALPAGVSERGGTAGERHWETGIETQGGREGQPAGRWPDQSEERKEEAGRTEVSDTARPQKRRRLVGGGWAWPRGR